MDNGSHDIDQMPVIRDLSQFDQRSGNFLERLVFNNRLLFVIICAVVTAVLGFEATKVRINASFEKMIPQSHPYIRNYLDNKNQLRGLGNSLRIVVENTNGNLFDPDYLEVLKNINDEVFLTPGVDRAWMKSLWTPATRWTEVTEAGFQGGPVMPDNYDGSPKTIEQLRLNVARAGLVGNIIGNDFRSTTIIVPLLDRDSETGEALDFSKLSRSLDKIREKYEHPVRAPGNNNLAKETGKIKVHIAGFAKVVGDIIEGLGWMELYFAISFIITAIALYAFTRCLRSTLLALGKTLVAVIWQVGIVTLCGFELDPYSILVPFLVFAIGLSHGAQKMNGISQDIGRGTHKLVAARYTFRRLFLPGVTALLADAVGFAVLMFIDIPVIRELAMTASIGVATLIITNLLLLPVFLSYTGVNPKAAEWSLREEHTGESRKGIGRIWNLLEQFAVNRRWAVVVIAVVLVLAVAGFAVSLNLKTGDLDPGAPELRPNSRYNLDVGYITKHYSLSSDIFAVIVKTPQDGCGNYETLVEADRLGWALRQVPQVHATASLADGVRQITAGSFEGNPKWLTLSRNQDILNYGVQNALRYSPELANNECSVMPLSAYLADHKAETLDKVMAVVEDFAKTHSNKNLLFLPAAGTAGIEAATNIVVKQANWKMLGYVYAAVIFLCFITFRSWRAVVVAVVPLIVTSILCEALMVMLGIGVKVATLPVVALGVGIGVDYALYILSVQLAGQRAGQTLGKAYSKAVRFTGRVVVLVGFMLAAGVITWAWSPIKFQADMGILLAFMFFWNMIGALVLIPALSQFLLGTPVNVQKSHYEELTDVSSRIHLEQKGNS
ncbi:MAG TPA: MMPL family transporter [Thermoguttaceae bacterium]